MICRRRAITVWREIFVRRVFRGVRVGVCVKVFRIVREYV